MIVLLRFFSIVLFLWISVLSPSVFAADTAYPQGIRLLYLSATNASDPAEADHIHALSSVLRESRSDISIQTIELNKLHQAGSEFAEADIAMTQQLLNSGNWDLIIGSGTELDNLFLDKKLIAPSVTPLLLCSYLEHARTDPLTLPENSALFLRNDILSDDVELLKEWFPEAPAIAVISSSLYGSIVKSTPATDNSPEIIVLDGSQIKTSEMLDAVEKLPPNSAIVLDYWNSKLDNNKGIRTFRGILNLIKRRFPYSSPILVTRHDNLPQESLGGYASGSYSAGVQTGNTALAVLQGKLKLEQQILPPPPPQLVLSMDALPKFLAKFPRAIPPNAKLQRFGASGEESRYASSLDLLLYTIAGLTAVLVIFFYFYLRRIIQINSVMHALPLRVFVTDGTGKVYFSQASENDNPIFFKRLRRQGKITAAGWKLFHEPITRVLHTGLPETMEYTYIGRRRKAQFQRLPARIFGKPTVLWISIDIQELYDEKQINATLLEYFRTTLASIGDGVFVTDADGKITLFNTAAADLIEVPPEELQNRAAEELVMLYNQESDHTMILPIRQVLASGTVLTAVKQAIVSPSGTMLRLIDSSIAPIRNAAGSISGTVTVFRDVTDEYHSQQELERCLQMMRQAATQANLHFFVVDLKTMQAQTLLETATDSQEAIPSSTFLFESWFEEESTAAIQAGLGALQRGAETEFTVDCRGVRKQKEFFRLTAKTLEVGNPKTVIGVFQDITEYSTMEHEVADTRSLLHTILENLPSAAYIKEKIGNELHIVSANQHLASFLGIPLEQIIGKSMLEVMNFLPAQANQIHLLDEKIIDDGTQMQTIEPRVDSSGKTHFVKITKAVIPCADGRKLLLGLDTDVTELENAKLKAESAEQAMRKTLENLNNSIKNAGIVNRCLEKITVENDFQRAMDFLLETICRTSGADRGYIIHLDATTEEGIAECSWHLPTIQPIPRRDSHAGSKFKNMCKRLLANVDVIIPDTFSPPEDLLAECTLLRQLGVLSSFAAGIWVDGELYGYVGLDFIKTKRSFTSSDLRMLHDAANLYLIARERNRQLEVRNQELIDFNNELQTYIKQDETVKECMELLILRQDLASSITGLLEKIGPNLNAVRCTVHSFSDSREKKTIHHQWVENIGVCNQSDVPTIAFDQDNWPGCFEELQRSGIVIVDATSAYGARSGHFLAELQSYFVQTGIFAIEMVVIRHNGNIWGYIAAERSRAHGTFAEVDSRLLEAAARVVEVLLNREEISKILLRSEQEKEAILNNLEIPILLFDKDINIVHANPAAILLSKMDKANLIGKPCPRMFCNALEIPENCPISATIAAHQNVHVERRVNNRDYIVNTYPICDDGEVTGILEYLVDMTEEKQNQEKLQEAARKAEEAARAKSLFLATMSHEIRTPLNAVIGFSELLQSTSLSPENQMSYLHSINFAGKALLNLINDILDLSKIESSELPIVPVKSDLRQLTSEISAIFQHRTAEKSLDFSIELPAILPLLYLDIRRVRQVLLNLVGNAVKFTNTGFIRIVVDFRKTESSAGTLTLDVADSGSGVAPEYREKIFEAFVQDNQMRGTRTENGTGLGLAIARRLVECMDGTLTLTETSSHGSTFRMELKNVRYEDHAPENGSPKMEAQAQEEFQGNLHLLLVDDVQLNLKVLSAMAAKLHCTTVCANSGKEALEILRTQTFDCILTDLWMPEMNGEEFAHAAREIVRPGLPIAVVTADTERSEFDKTVFTATLLKPYTLEKLKNMLIHAKSNA